MFARRLYSTVVSTSPSAILDISLKYVPEFGFEAALVKGIRDCGYSDAAHSVFPKGTFNLVQHHLKNQRLSIEKTASSLPDKTSADKIISHLVKSRLQANIEALGSSKRLSEALAIMTLPSNLPESLEELHLLSDEIMYFAKDRSTGFDWYTKRGGLSAVYASSELFMTQDSSSGFQGTMQFVDRRLEEFQLGKYMRESTEEWVKFNTIAAYNLIRSLTR